MHVNFNEGCTRVWFHNSKYLNDHQCKKTVLLFSIRMNNKSYDFGSTIIR